MYLNKNNNPEINKRKNYVKEQKYIIRNYWIALIIINVYSWKFTGIFTIIIHKRNKTTFTYKIFSGTKILKLQTK